MKRECKWIVCQIPEGKDAGCAMVCCGQKSDDNEKDFNDFAAAFPDDQPRWGVYDLNFEKGGVNNNKVVFVNYVPDDCTKNQLKFAYANHKETVKAKLQVNKELQINDKCDITRAKFIDEFWSMWSQVRISIKKMAGVLNQLLKRLTSATTDSFLPRQNAFYHWYWCLSSCQRKTNQDIANRRATLPWYDYLDDSPVGVNVSCYF